VKAQMSLEIILSLSVAMLLSALLFHFASSISNGMWANIHSLQAHLQGDIEAVSAAKSLGEVST